MDEILYPGSLVDEAAASEEKLTLAQRLELLRGKYEDALFRFDDFRQRHRLRATHFLAAALALGVVTTGFTMYTHGYAVTVDGQELGVVSDKAQFQQIVDRVEDRTSEILGYDYELTAQVSYKHRIVEKNKLSSLSGFETYLFNQVDEVMRCYTLSVDGVELGARTDNQELTELLESLKAPYITENTILSEFTVPVRIDYDYTSSDAIVSMEDITKVLTSNTVEAATYTVEKGNTYLGIAKAHDMSLDELLEMNPQATLESLMPGDVLTVRQSVPYLSVRTVDQVTYEEAIASPVEYVEDDTMYQGQSKVVDPGSEGLARVSARVTRINGRETQRDITNTVRLSEPTTKVVAKGTKARPKTMPTGSFIWPVRGTITSNYGSRSLFGTYNFHGGLDIACPYGTPVKAADGGTVTYAGWQGSYGNLVVIRHDNGKETYYAHNSSLSVSVGQKVYQGQQIARVGMTGTATGYHCHFEVRINGQRQNPRRYLP